MAGTVEGWHTAAGELVEWRLKNGEAVAAGALTHPVGPSFLQRDHLVAATAKRATDSPHRIQVIVNSLFRKMPQEPHAGVHRGDDELFAATPHWRAPDAPPERHPINQLA